MTFAALVDRLKTERAGDVLVPAERVSSLRQAGRYFAASWLEVQRMVQQDPVPPGNKNELTEAVRVTNELVGSLLETTNDVQAVSLDVEASNELDRRTAVILHC